MNDKIIGLRLDVQTDSEQNSAIMKKICSALFDSGRVTFSQFLFPYVDSLLIADNNALQPSFFGSHALLWDIDIQLVNDCIAAVCGNDTQRPELVEIEFNASEIADFFGEPYVLENGLYVGGFASLLTGKIRPWAIREHARGFCSFAEHIARMSGFSVHGLTADYIAVRCEHEPDEAELKRLFAAKTGGILKIKRG